MRPNRLWIFALALVVTGLVACVFDDKADSSAWLDQSKVPAGIGSEKLVIAEVPLVTARIGTDSLPFWVGSTGNIGSALGSTQELFFEMLVLDSLSLPWLQEHAGARADLMLTLDSTFYNYFSQGDSLPFYDALTVKVGWSLESDLTTEQSDSLYTLPDTTWHRTLLNLIRKEVTWADSSYPLVLSLDGAASSVLISLPPALQVALQQAQGAFRLQLHLKFDGAQRIYRFQASSSTRGGAPKLLIHADTLNYAGLIDSSDFLNRVAQVGFNTEACPDCLVLHGGIRESLNVEIPGDSIWAALKRALGDSLLATSQIDSLYTDQIVVQASIDFPSDVDSHNNELGYPVPVRASSLLDSISAAGVVGGMIAELSRFDTTDIRANGYPNLLFFPERDTLSVQVTYGVRYWLQSARLGSRIRATLRLGPPVLSPKDPELQSSFSSHSRWDLGNPDSLRVRVQVWLTEKR